MNKYQSYKPSSIEWIGEVPDNWEFYKLGNLFSVNGRVGWKNLRSDEYIDEPNFIFLSTPNLKFKNIDFDNVNYITEFRYDESPEIKLQIDDIILVKSGSTLGIVNIVRFLPKPSTINGSSVLIRKKFTNDLSSFYHYFFSSHYFQNLMSVTQSGVGVPSVNQSDINNFKVLKPSFKEQQQIVQYLNEKTELIDTIISTKERKITLLKEQRTSLINQVVTKGLNPDVKMKDSGVEWIGEIPEVWTISKLKYNGVFFSGYSFDSGDFLSEGEIRVIKISNIQNNGISWDDLSFVPDEFYDKYQNFIVQKGDLIFVLTRPIISTGIKICFYDEDYKVLLNQRNSVFRPNPIKLNKIFTYYLVRTLYFFEEFKQQIKETNQPNISTEQISNIKIFLPPINEQLQIVEYLDSKTKEIDDLLQLEQKKIDILKEYRQSLISEVVTGKIKVTQ